MAREFRQEDDTTPIVMMGYYNPIYIYGVDRFLADGDRVELDGGPMLGVLVGTVRQPG